MERIQEALEKAKLHRQSKAREDQIITKADDIDHQQLDSDDAVYNYIHSHINPRTFNVDQNVLREHRIVAGLKDDHLPVHNEPVFFIDKIKKYYHHLLIQVIADIFI